MTYEGLRLLIDLGHAAAAFGAPPAQRLLRQLPQKPAPGGPAAIRLDTVAKAGGRPGAARSVGTVCSAGWTGV